MLSAISPRVLKELEGWEPDLREALAKKEPADLVEAVLGETRGHLETICRTTPDPGWTAPHMRAFTISGAIYVAFHLALAPRGYDAARTWPVLEAATRSHFGRMSPLEKRMASDGMFGWPMKALSRWVAKRSKAGPDGVGGWVFDFVEPEDGFDYGVNYERCAIRELAIQHGAAALAPYICLADVPGSEAFGWGLVRTETLAQGGKRCDFRFRRGGETKVRVHLPVTG